MISHVINPDHYGHGWHGTGTVGAMGATGAAASLLGLSVEQVGSALAMGASSAAGLRRNFGSDVKSYHAGNAARAGVMAAELAARGFVGSDEILESKYGFYNVMTPGNGVPRTRPNRGFGDPWNTLDPGITTKLFPSCGSTHASIGSILVLREAHGLRPEDIKQVDARVTDISYGNLQYPRPRTGLEGKFSMQYCLARALVDGWLGIDDFTDDAVLEDRIQELIPRINLHHDQDLTDAYVWGAHRPAVVTVETVSGDVLTHRTDAPPGSPGNFTREMLVNKVRDCISRGAIVGKADDVLDAIDHLDEVANISNLMKMMSGL
jgi:2-methylcitrate dehydratase PrpD